MEKGDVSPELLEKILTDFRNTIKNSEQIRHLEKLVAEGKATYAEALDYAEEVGNALAGAFQKNLSSAVLPDGKMYYNIAQKVVRPTMEEDYNIISEMAVRVQQGLNDSAGLRIKAQRAPMNEDRLKMLIEKIVNKDDFDAVKWVLGAPVVNFSDNIVDRTLEENAEFHEKAGLHPKITRTVVGGCCPWCTKLAGTYNYSDIRGQGNPVFQRHENCRCTITYDPGRGKVQNVHTKVWSPRSSSDIIEMRKAIGMKPTSAKQILQERIRNGTYSLAFREQKYLEHIEGTPQYKNTSNVRTEGSKKKDLSPSKLYLSREEVKRIISMYSGTGEPKTYKNGEVTGQEFITLRKVVGEYQDRNGWHKTNRLCLDHSSKGTHVYPVQERKK